MDIVQIRLGVYVRLKSNGKVVLFAPPVKFPAFSGISSSLVIRGIRGL